MIKDIILTSQSIEELRKAAGPLSELGSRKIDTLAPFERRRWLENVEALRQLYAAKEQSLSQKRFRFVGEPIPGASARVLGAQQDYTEPPRAAHVVRALRGEKVDVDEKGHVVVDRVTDSHVSVRAASVALRAVAHCVLHVECSGPLYVHDVEGSEIHVRAHQVRLHNVVDSSVVVDHVENNRIVIEGCRGLRVVGDVEVDDFSWPSKERNPHFRIERSEMRKS